MNDDAEHRHGHDGSLDRKLADSLSGEPRDRDELLQVLEDAKDRGIVDEDDFRHAQGVLEVGEQQGGARHHGAALADGGDPA